MNSLRRLFEYVGPYKKRFSLSMFLSVLSTASRSSQPFMIGLILNELAANIKVRMETGIGGVNFDFIGFMVILLIVTGILDAIAEYGANYLLADVVQDTMFDIRLAINRKLNRLPVSYFDSHQQGEILGRITNDVDTVNNAMQQVLLRVVGAALTLTFSVVAMLIISPVFALVVFIIFPTCLWIAKAIVRRSQPSFQKLQDVLGNLTGYVQEYYSGFSVVKLYGQEGKVTEDFNKINEELYHAGFRSNVLSALLNPLLSGVINLAYILMFVVGSFFVLGATLTVGGTVLIGSMQIGGLQSFIQYIWQASGPIGQVSQLSGALQTATASLARVFELLDEKEQQPDAEDHPINLETVQGDVLFQNVAFGYGEDLLMKDVSFEVKSGQTIAIVGPTGAGKTTLINLLMRFYEVSGGAILVDGVDIREMTRTQVRSLFGMVLQDPWLYYATIADNIRFGNLTAKDYQVVDAAKTANVHRFIRTLPDGYATMLNKESSNISQGQKQLLTIARVLIGNPKILILDEATSSVDTRLEVLIQKAMKKAMDGRTSFVIAHRLSTIRDADLILVMDHGSIVEQGTHDQLLAQGGMYQELYESQFSEEEE